MRGKTPYYTYTIPTATNNYLINCKFLIKGLFYVYTAFVIPYSKIISFTKEQCNKRVFVVGTYLILYMMWKTSKSYLLASLYRS